MSFFKGTYYPHRNYLNILFLPSIGVVFFGKHAHNPFFETISCCTILFKICQSRFNRLVHKKNTAVKQTTRTYNSKTSPRYENDTRSSTFGRLRLSFIQIDLLSKMCTTCLQSCATLRIQILYVVRKKRRIIIAYPSYPLLFFFYLLFIDSYTQVDDEWAICATNDPFLAV